MASKHGKQSQQQQQQQQQQQRGASKKDANNTKNREVTQAQRQRQALLLADSFDVFMRPLSIDQPRTLFPVANVPLIEYTLQFLASQQIDVIYVFCCAHAEKVQDYIESSDWSTNQEVTVIPIISKSNGMTAGDALREINAKGLMRDDFILVYGDVVANIDLAPIINRHTERKKKDKECIITAVFKEALPGHRTRSYHDDIILVLDSNTNQILFYDSNPNTRFVELDHEKFSPEHHREVQIRHDLIDCGIAICSNEVLCQFQENFDYADLIQFTRGIVNDEILSVKAHAHIINGQYAARANCLRTYRSLTFDVINRWTYPLVPDNNLIGNTSYKTSRHAIYKDKDVHLSQSSIIGEKTVIGENTSVGANTKISCSTIGKNCKIGENVTITGSFIWDDVIIGDNVTITDSVVANKACIKSGATAQRGCVVSFGVTIGSNHQLSPFSKIIRTKNSQTKEVNLGKGGEGHMWVGTPVLNAIEFYTPEQIQQLLLIVSKELVPMDFEVNVKRQMEEQDSDSEEVEEDVYVSNRERYLKEVSETVFRTESEAGSEWVENVTFELRGLKLAYDTTFLDAAEALLFAILDFVPCGDVEHFKQMSTKWKPLMDMFLDGQNRADDEIELIFKLQEYTETNVKHIPHFISIVKTLNSAGILSSRSIKAWCEEILEGEEEEKQNEFPEICRNLLVWLSTRRTTTPALLTAFNSTSTTTTTTTTVIPTTTVTTAASVTVTTVATTKKISTTATKKIPTKPTTEVEEDGGDFYSDDDFGSDEEPDALLKSYSTAITTTTTTTWGVEDSYSGSDKDD